MEKELVIGICGKIGSGKTEVANYLSEKYGASVMQFSGILIDILDRLHVEATRENLQKLGTSLRRDLGSDIIVNALKKDIQKCKSKILVIDGIRFLNEVELLRTFENNFLIDLNANPELRYERCKKRGEKGEENVSFEDFIENDKKQTESEIDKVSILADFLLSNFGTKEELYEKIDDIIKSKL